MRKTITDKRGLDKVQGIYCSERGYPPERTTEQGGKSEEESARREDTERRSTAPALPAKFPAVVNSCAYFGKFP